jgi:hypothetical protein
VEVTFSDELKQPQFQLRPYKVLLYRPQGPYSQHLVLFLTYEWVQLASVTLKLKSFAVTNTLAYWERSKEMKCCEYGRRGTILSHLCTTCE